MTGEAIVCGNDLPLINDYSHGQLVILDKGYEDVLTTIIRFSECQTDEDGNVVARLQAENRMLRSMLLERPELDVRLLENNNRLTRFYTGMPTFDSFLALVEYLTPKAKELRAWKGSSTSLEEKQQHGSQCFGGL
ncbi:uncharacterized protein [Dysidea avara]|uniref:uncharacterized protein n=1 Tax=Dysidea avara TaxID=196820 RepID=UPI00331DAB1A